MAEPRPGIHSVEQFGCVYGAGGSHLSCALGEMWIVNFLFPVIQFAADALRFKTFDCMLPNGLECRDLRDYYARLFSKE